MKSSLKVLALSACFGLTFVASAQESTPQERVPVKAETSLVKVTINGTLHTIKIYDTGMDLIRLFGTPVDVLPLSIGAGGVGPGGGFGGGTQGPAGDGGPAFGGTGGGGGGSTADARLFGNPFRMGRGMNQTRPGQVPGRGGPASGGGQGPAVPGNRAGGGGGGAASSTRVLFTRWVYRNGASQYAFVLDKFNRVVQIEAMGLRDKNVETSRCRIRHLEPHAYAGVPHLAITDGEPTSPQCRTVGFGSTFADIITAYNVPDAYEISGDTIVMRYLVRDHVAFRLSRLKPGGPHQVTGIVVAAGKA